MMDSRTLLITALAISLVISFGAIIYLYQESQRFSVEIPVPKEIVEATPRPTYSAIPSLVMIDLFFLNNEHTMLAVEQRQITQPPTINNRVQVALEELLEGPRSAEKIHPLPAGVGLQSVYWTEKNGRIYASFSKELIEYKPTHALAEWAMIYSIVNTVSAQSPVVKTVQILVDGQIVQNNQTLWDWSLPFEKDDTFVQYNMESGG